MIDATPGRICRLKASANSGQSPRGWADAQKPRYGIPQVQQPFRLLDGSKRDGCVVRNFADVVGVAHEAMLHSHALCPAVCPGHRGKPPAVDESLHTFSLAPSTRHDPHSCAHAQLNGGQLRQFPSFQASAPATEALQIPKNLKASCVNRFQTADRFLPWAKADKRRNAS